MSTMRDRAERQVGKLLNRLNNDGWNVRISPSLSGHLGRIVRVALYDGAKLAAYHEVHYPPTPGDSIYALKDALNAVIKQVELT